MSLTKWPLTPLDTDFAEGILPADTWTEIILLSQTPINGDVYACTTAEKIKVKEKCMRTLSTMSEIFEKNEEYKYYELVAVKVDEKWRRGRLICFNSFVPNDNTLIQLIDDGSFCIIDFKDIFRLHFFDKLEPLALFIKFKNFIPKTRKLIVKPLFLELNSLTAGFVFVDVKLEDSDNKQTEETIVDQGDQNNEIVKVKGNITDDFQSVNLENDDYCIVSHFESLDSIFLCKAVKDINNLYETHNFDVIVKTMKSEDREIKSQLSVGDFVKVCSPYFKDMYRATIINIDGAKYQVRYIDFGSTEIVGFNDIFKLSDDLKINTQLPLEVSMDIQSIVKKTVLIEGLFDNLAHNGVVLSINFTTKNSTDIASVILKEVVSGKSVNKEVLELLATKIEMPLKNCDVCCLAHFENVNNMFVFKKEELKITYDTSNSVDLNVKKNLAVGDIVKVYSPIFDGLFRAKIVNRVDKEHVNVYHIDFGSTEVVSIKHVYELSEDLKIKPGIAIKIRMKVPSNVKINKEIKEFYSELCTNLEPLSLEFDDSCEEGLENCTLKVISIGVNLTDMVLQMSN